MATVADISSVRAFDAAIGNTSTVCLLAFLVGWQSRFLLRHPCLQARVTGRRRCSAPLLRPHPAPHPRNLLMLHAAPFKCSISLAAQAVVHYWAPWCEPCTFMDEVFRELAKSAPSTALFLRVRADSQPRPSHPLVTFFDGRVKQAGHTLHLKSVLRLDCALLCDPHVVLRSSVGSGGGGGGA